MHTPTQELYRILFLDIETASGHPNFMYVPGSFKVLWQHKMDVHYGRDDSLDENEYQELYKSRAAIYAEFGRVVCISLGIISTKTEETCLRVKVLKHEDETVLLDQFSELLNIYYPDKTTHFLCGHNIKEFDIPYLCRRYRILNKPLPRILEISGHKPWQVHHLIDTMDMWKFGDYKYYTSLELLCAALDIPSPKSDMRGDKVSEAFWDGKIDDITRYATQDVIATCRVYLRLVGLPIIDDDNIVIVSDDIHDQTQSSA